MKLIYGCIIARYQNPKYPELCRGLVAVLLYYNAHRMLVSSLRLLIEGSTGRTWIPRVDPACAQHLGQFVDQIMNDGLFMNILSNYFISYFYFKLIVFNLNEF